MDTSQHEDILNLVLKDKVTDAAEIELHFFEYCNLACAFCGQDHDSQVGMNTVMNKAERVKEFIEQSRKDKFIINMMGGELFNDLVSDDLFVDYLNFALDVDSHAQQAGKHCTFNWVTNLVFEKWERVQKLLDTLRMLKVKTNVSTSYDFAGRPLNEARKDMFHQNLERFGKRSTQ